MVIADKPTKCICKSDQSAILVFADAANLFRLHMKIT